MKFKDLPIGSRWIVKDSYGNTAIAEKINNDRSVRRGNTKVVNGRHEWSFGRVDRWSTKPSKEINPIKMGGKK